MPRGVACPRAPSVPLGAVLVVIALGGAGASEWPFEGADSGFSFHASDSFSPAPASGIAYGLAWNWTESRLDRLLVADLDQDGAAEIVGGHAGGLVVLAANGSERWRYGSDRPFHVAFVANVTPSAGAEIVAWNVTGEAGNETATVVVVEAAGILARGDPPHDSSALRFVHVPVEPPADAFTVLAVADADGVDPLEIVTASVRGATGARVDAYRLDGSLAWSRAVEGAVPRQAAADPSSDVIAFGGCTDGAPTSTLVIDGRGRVLTRYPPSGSVHACLRHAIADVLPGNSSEIVVFESPHASSRAGRARVHVIDRASGTARAVDGPAAPWTSWSVASLQPDAPDLELLAAAGTGEIYGLDSGLARTIAPLGPTHVGATADLDGNGVVDAVYLNATTGEVEVATPLTGSLPWKYRFPGIHPGNLTDPRAWVVVADLDQDGAPEIVLLAPELTVLGRSAVAGRVIAALPPLPEPESARGAETASAAPAFGWPSFAGGAIASIVGLAAGVAIRRRRRARRGVDINARLRELEQRDWEVRRKATEALSEAAVADASVRNELRRRLEHDDPQVRAAAASALTGVPLDPAVTAAILRRFEDESAEVRMAAVSAVPWSAPLPPAVRDALLGRLDDEHAGVRATAVVALASTAPSDPLVRDALRRRLRDPEAAVRLRAAQALQGTAATDPAVRDEYHRLLDDADYHVRAAASDALAAAAGPAVPPTPSPTASPAPGFRDGESAPTRRATAPPSPAPHPERIAPVADRPRPLSVFLCHASNDKPVVRDLHARLRAAGVAPWLDEIDILPGQDWRDVIPQAVRASDAVIVCLSRASTSKEGYVQREIRDVLDVAEEKLDDAIFVVPVLVEDVPIPRKLARWQAVRLDAPDGFERLLASLALRAESLRRAGP